MAATSETEVPVPSKTSIGAARRVASGLASGNRGDDGQSNHCRCVTRQFLGETFGGAKHGRECFGSSRFATHSRSREP
jgi:hypothetical protein